MDNLVELGTLKRTTKKIMMQRICLQVNCVQVPDCAWTLEVVVGLDSAAHVNHHEAAVGGFDSELGVITLGVGGNAGHVVGRLDHAGVVVVHLDLDQTQLSKSILSFCGSSFALITLGHVGCRSFSRFK